MNKLIRIFKYTFFDLIRSKWSILYFLFFAVTGYVLFSFNKEGSKSIVSLLNIVLIIIPLISMILGTMYLYNVREFIDLLLSQPIPRRKVFTGLYLGLTVSLSLGFVGGVLISMLISGVHMGENLPILFMLITVGVMLTFVFTALSIWISLSSNNKVKGIAVTIFLWLFMALLYDGLFLLWIIVFGDYPVEKHALVIAMLNPIDLSRILVLLELDSSALMGYTGAVFQKVFGTARGILLAGAAMMVWMVIPVLGFIRTGSRKDF